MQTPTQTHTVIQGDVVILSKADVVLSTLLGSCISVCMYDSVAGIGGMNHFLLPNGEGCDNNTALRFGVNAMEKLINGILSSGGRRDRLLCKAFGGAAIIPSLGHIGQENSAFATRYLADERITCVAHSLGGTQARRIRFWPTTGRAQQNLVEDSRAIGIQEQMYNKKEADFENKWKRTEASSVELF
ncbi:chemotaxis protein CheD [Asaia astilbis]|uniref:chemotaxis protein CheD n=1 Tax=Asaia astilbis TaxID=610244 RepID=UPI000A02443A|nr:chemotaxis protein CheD [Asaia astilbis]